MQVNIRKPDAGEEKRKAVCLKQLALDRQQLLLKWPFLGSIIMRMELIAVRDDRLRTACTDGSRIFVDIDFYGKLCREERLFVLAHEVWHSALLHFLRKQDRDQERFNIAADLEIHFTLQEEKKKMKEPWVLPHDPAWDGLSAEEIYERLPAFLKKQQQGRPGEQDDKGEQSGKEKQEEPDGGKQFDKHIYKGGKEITPEECAKEMQGKTKKTDGGQSGSGQEEENSVTFDSEYGPVISPDAAEQIRSRVVAAAQQVEQRNPGSLPAYLDGIVSRLMKPELPWQELLKQFVTSCYGGERRWCPPSRRYVWQDLYLPSMRSTRLQAVVALDTSGSTQSDMAQFFGELLSLMKSFGRFELTVIHCDAAVEKVETFTDSTMPAPDHQWEMHGGGGTDFRPVFQYVEEHKIQPELLIYFTDGYGPAPNKAPGYPVMWLLTQDHQDPCSWGRKVLFRN